MRIEIHYAKFHGTPDIAAYVEKRFAPLAKVLTRFEKEGEILILVELARATHHKTAKPFRARN